MFIVLLKFTEKKALAGQHMAAHNAWIQQGFDDGVFLLVGGLNPPQGGGIIANESSLEVLQARVSEDPFVVEGIVEAEIIEINPAKTEPRLAAILGV